jgi:non-ribosomal peptide synthetase component E (peptide arylation enzyme)
VTQSSVIDGLISENQALSERLLAIARSLDTRERGERWYGTWSMREVLVHLGNWAEAQATALELMARGERPVMQIGGLDASQEVDSVNAAGQKLLAAASWDESVAYFENAMSRHEAASRAAFRSLTPERLVPGKTAYELVVGVAAHVREHLEAARTWHAAVR